MMVGCMYYKQDDYLGHKQRLIVLTLSVSMILRPRTYTWLRPTTDHPGYWSICEG